MALRGFILLFYDAPDDPEFQAWLHGPHFDEVIAKMPGVGRITRLEILSPEPGERRYLALLHSDDIEATVAFRKGPGGAELREDAIVHGVRNRHDFAARVIYDTGQG
ncbi:MAG: hypothetical protein HY691_16105 [Chloroflexi bacterium]|nr:hypothetical protein [Chloroflexota bacterium]